MPYALTLFIAVIVIYGGYCLYKDYKESQDYAEENTKEDQKDKRGKSN